MTKGDWENIINNDCAAYEKLYMDYFKKFYNYGKKFTQTLILSKIQSRKFSWIYG